MAQIFIFGSSNAYGVGGTSGGWADIIKTGLHDRMYTQNGLGEVHEVYNFGKPGAVTSFVAETFLPLKQWFSRDKGEKIAILSIGGNDSRAEDDPRNYISSPETFETEMLALLNQMQGNFDRLFANGFPPYDEKKTLPFISKTTGKAYYFTNVRRQLFEDRLKFLCAKLGITFVKPNVSDAVWIQNYQHSDGLHPNSSGHKLMADTLMTMLNL